MADSFRDLLAWQKAMVLATDVYRITATFPTWERYGLASQLQRAAVAVPSDIAEGKGRLSKKEYVQMLYRGRGSLHETDTQLEIAKNLSYIEEELFARMSKQCAEVGRLLNGLIRSVQAQIDGVAQPESRIEGDGAGPTNEQAPPLRAES
jgi:four helix bundle protein